MAQDTICTGAKLAAIADAIRAKAGTAGAMTLDDMSAAVDGLPTGGGGDGLAALVSRRITAIPSPEAIEEVGEYAFAHCPSLAGEVSLPNATVIRSFAFEGCSGITAILAPRCESLFNVGTCANVERVEFPKVTLCVSQLRFGKVRDLCLPECTSFQGSVLGGSSGCARIERLRLPKMSETPAAHGSTSLASGTSTLTSISLDAVEQLYGYGTRSYSLIYNCTALTSVHLPNVRSLGGYVFYGCLSLTSLWLPSCRSMAGLAIGADTPIDTIVLPGESVCALGGQLNGALPIASGSGYVYVPASLVAQYQSAANWSAYASQIRAIEDWPDVVAQARALAEGAAQGWDD